MLLDTDAAAFYCIFFMRSVLLAVIGLYAC